MSKRLGLVLDANIVLRAALGRRVRHILRKFDDQASFYSADIGSDIANWTTDRVELYLKQR